MQATGVVGNVAGGRSCRVDGRTTDSAWLYVDCSGTRGWIDRRLVEVAGGVSAVPVTAVAPAGGAAGGTLVRPLGPLPSPVPTQAVYYGWKSSFFANPNLAGAPTVFADVQNVDLNWDIGSPHPTVPVDNFSARFERTLDLLQGYYTFMAQADDGVRVYVDGEIVIDESARRQRPDLLGRSVADRPAPASRGVPGVDGAGEHPLRLPVFGAGAALAGGLLQRRTWARGTPLFSTWSRPTSNPTGPLLGHQLAAGCPVPADYWNGRWIGKFKFDGGNYYFRARAEDGVRVYIDQQLVIDGWNGGPVDRTNRFLGVGGGEHTITVDYYEQAGNAYLQVWWYRDTSGPAIPQ